MKHRPIRWLCLADTPENIVDYIRYNLCAWGGIGNLIVPSPRSEKEYKACREMVERYRPDAILFSSETISDYGRQIITSAPIQAVDAGSHRRIEDLISGNAKLTIHGAVVPHLLRDFPEYQERVDEVLESISEHPVVKMYSTSMDPTAFRAAGLDKHNALSSEMKESLHYALKNSIAIHRKNLSLSYSLNDFVVDGYDFQFLYLIRDKQSDLDVLSSYWNDSLLSVENRMILSWDTLLTDLRSFLETLRKCCPHFKYLRIVVSMTEEEACELRSIVQDAVLQQEMNIEVDVIYDDFTYLKGQLKITVGKERAELIRSDDTYINIPFPIPEWASGRACAFAVDVEVRESGKRFGVPYSKESGTLLTYGLANLQLFGFDVDTMERLMSRTRIHPGIGGVSFITSHKRADGHQRVVQISVPTSDELVEVYLRLKGYQYGKNPASQYARVLVKRLEHNGLSNKYLPEMDVLSLMRGGHNSVLHLNITQLKAEIGRRRKTIRRNTTTDSTLYSSEVTGPTSVDYDGNQLRSQLSNLLRVGMIQRGNEIECPDCSLKEWYSIEESGEYATCAGCGEKVLVPLNSTVVFKLTDLGIRLLNTGGRAVAQAMGVFGSNHTASVVAVGGDVTIDGVSIEVDAFRFSDNEFAVVECKDRRDAISEEELRAAVEKLVENALLIGASSAYLYIATANSIQASIAAMIRSLYAHAAEQGVQLSIIVNDKIFIEERAKVECYEYRGVQYSVSTKPPSVVGTFFRNHGNRSMTDYLNKKAVDEL